MRDHFKILWEFLTTDDSDADSLYAACGTRVWTNIIDPEWTNTTKALLFYCEQSKPEPARNCIRSSFRFHCFGGSGNPDDALDVAIRLHYRLDAATATTATGELRHAECIDMTIGPDDPERGWPRHFALYEVLTI